ncbi:hypothetical protein ACIQUZ_05140 [Streptomyces griseus]|uniref:hypothetical protein n=1 Tax=Streptomyces griseus TaxID=1911 RepID=UPI00131DABC1|nr:hypothetical protein [Streptomyces griseus]
MAPDALPGAVPETRPTSVPAVSAPAGGGPAAATVGAAGPSCSPSPTCTRFLWWCA